MNGKVINGEKKEKLDQDTIKKKFCDNVQLMFLGVIPGESKWQDKSATNGNKMPIPGLHDKVGLFT